MTASRVDVQSGAATESSKGLTADGKSHAVRSHHLAENTAPTALKPIEHPQIFSLLVVKVEGAVHAVLAFATEIVIWLGASRDRANISTLVLLALTWILLFIAR